LWRWREGPPDSGGTWCPLLASGLAHQEVLGARAMRNGWSLPAGGEARRLKTPQQPAGTGTLVF